MTCAGKSVQPCKKASILQIQELIKKKKNATLESISYDISMLFVCISLLNIHSYPDVQHSAESVKIQHARDIYAP